MRRLMTLVSLGEYRLRVSCRRCADHAGERAQCHEKRCGDWRSPSFPDRGKLLVGTAMDLPPETISRKMLLDRALEAEVRAENGVLRHVKPHGMLYNQAAKDPALADAIALRCGL